MSTNHRSFSPALRGALYYAIFFGVVGAYFAYVNVVYINRGLTGVQIGILNAVSSAMVMISSPFFTGLADRTGWHRRMLFLSNFVFGLSILGLHFTTNFPLMLLITGLGAIFAGPVMPLSDMLIVKMSNRYELDYGGMRIWGSIGFFIVCTAFGRIWDLIGLDNLFLVGGILFALRALCTFLIDPIGKVTHEEHETAPAHQNAIQSVINDRGFLIFLLACLLWASCWNTFSVYASIYMDQLGGTSMLVGLMMSLTALGEVPSVFIADRLLRRIGHLRVFILSIGLFLIVLFAVSRITDPTWMVIVNGFRGFGFGFFIVGGVRYVDQTAPRIHSGTYQSFYSIITFTVPNLIAMPLMGFLFDHYTIQHVFTAQLILGILALLLFSWMFWQSNRQLAAA
ncbi:MAG: MFS transporter [Anaerolineae bacterium]|jgi:PPP family 3-phenylpropionic acid transporter|nr:MFS transporter [Anaerolineae bacterium]